MSLNLVYSFIFLVWGTWSGNPWQERSITAERVESPRLEARDFIELARYNRRWIWIGWALLWVEGYGTVVLGKIS